MITVTIEPSAISALIRDPMLIQRAAAPGKEIKLTERQHLFAISDATPDDYGSVFTNSGWDLSHRLLKKRVTYGHPSYSDTDDSNIIGIGDEFITDKLYSILTLEDQETNPKAERIHKKLTMGSLTDASIRCRVSDGRMGDESLGEDPKLFYYTIKKLIDWGVVMEGSNTNAMKERSAIEQFIKERTPNRYHSEIAFLQALKTRYHFFN